MLAFTFLRMTLLHTV